MTPCAVSTTGCSADVNDLARHTGWLHGAVLGYATYGLVLFAALLLAGVLVRRAGTDRALAAAGWAALAMLIAVGLNQPLVAAFAEARPYTDPSRPAGAGHPEQRLLLSQRPRRDGRRGRGRAVAGLPRLGAIAARGAVMAFSRVYIAAHYPWDVVAGLAFGALVALLGLAAAAGTADRVTGVAPGVQPGVRRPAFGGAAPPRAPAA